MYINADVAWQTATYIQSLDYVEDTLEIIDVHIVLSVFLMSTILHT
jgi:hypothetical protein